MGCGPSACAADEEAKEEQSRKESQERYRKDFIAAFNVRMEAIEGDALIETLKRLQYNYNFLDVKLRMNKEERVALDSIKKFLEVFGISV